MPTQLEIEMRIDQVIDWVLKRYRKGMIKVLYRQQYDLSDATFSKDFAEALLRIKEEVKSKSMEERLDLAVAAREGIIRKAHEENKLQLALSAEKDLAELEGLYKGDKDKGTTFVFDFGGLPEAPDDDGPVPDYMIEEYDTGAADDE